MKKRYLILALFFVGCAPEVTGSSSYASLPGSSSSDIAHPSSDPVSLPPVSSEPGTSSVISSNDYVYSVPTTLSHLYAVVYENRVLEGEETATASYEETTVSYYSNDLEKHETISEELTMYDGFSYTIGTETKIWKNYEESSAAIYAPSEAEYTVYRGVKNEFFYAIKDYAEGKDKDSASKYRIIGEGTPGDDEILAAEVLFNTSMFASYYFLTYLNSYFINTLGEAYPISYQEQGEDLVYSLSVEGNASGDEYGNYVLNYGLEFVLNQSDGFLKKFTLSIHQASEGELLSEIERTYEITRGAACAEAIAVEDPDNYWLQEFTVGFWYPDPDRMGERIYCEDGVLPLGKTVYPYAKTQYPEKALDTDLKAVSTSDSSVVSQDSSGNFYTVSQGACTLKVISASGIEGETEITVGSVDITAITLTLYYGGISYMGNIFPGDQLEILYKISPAGTLEDIVFTSSDSSVAKVSIINSTPYLIAVAPGTATITACSKADPSVEGTLSVTISDNTTSVSSYLMAKKWKYLYAEICFYFDSETTGYMTYNGEKYSTFIYEDKGDYQFSICGLTWIDGTLCDAECSLRTKLDYFSATFTFRDDGYEMDRNFFSYDL